MSIIENLIRRNNFDAEDKKLLLRLNNTIKNSSTFTNNDSIKFDINNSVDNLTIITDLDINASKLCLLYNNDNYIGSGVYKNGKIIILEENYISEYDVNFDTGNITRDNKRRIEFISQEVHLDVCSAGSTEATRNLELLNLAYFEIGDHFTVNIDAGIGVAKFIPNVGGEGHITTAEGVNVHYNIGIDGSVIKTIEIDIVELYNKIKQLSI